MPPKKLSAEQDRAVVDRYLSGEPSTKLAAAFDVHTDTIFEALRRYGVQSRPSAVANRHRSLNESAFDVVTEESAYWVGFLMADGCISDAKDRPPRVELGVCADDAEHLEAFKRFLGSNHRTGRLPETPVGGYVRRAQVRLSIQSARLAGALGRYGVLPRKSLTARVVGLEMNRHFWRGVVDGDGCVGWQRRRCGTYALVQLAGSEPLTAQFVAFARSLTDTRVRPCPVGSIFHLTFPGRHAVPLLRCLYGECAVALGRKARSAGEVLRGCDAAGRRYVVEKGMVNVPPPVVVE